MNRRRVRREYYLQVRVVPVDVWNKVCRDYYRYGDKSCYFMTANDWPIYILETRPGAYRAAEIGNELMGMKSFDDGDTVDRLYSELSRIAGRPAAEWFYSTAIQRHRNIDREDQEDRARAWLQNHDVLSEIDEISSAGEYDDMFMSFPTVSDSKDYNRALYGIFLYGHEIGKKRDTDKIITELRATINLLLLMIERQNWNRNDVENTIQYICSGLENLIADINVNQIGKEAKA